MCNQVLNRELLKPGLRVLPSTIKARANCSPHLINYHWVFPDPANFRRLYQGSLISNPKPFYKWKKSHLLQRLSTCCKVYCVLSHRVHPSVTVFGRFSDFLGLECKLFVQTDSFSQTFRYLNGVLVRINNINADQHQQFCLRIRGNITSKEPSYYRNFT